MGKTIFITGATKNTGLGIARKFAADGWNVAVSSRDRAAAEETAQALAAEFGVDALGLAMDPAEVPSIRAAFAALKDRFGRLEWMILISQSSPQIAFGTKTAQPSIRQTPIPSEE